MYTEVVMRGLTVESAQVLTVYFDEDGYVCDTHLIDQRPGGESGSGS